MSDLDPLAPPEPEEGERADARAGAPVAGGSSASWSETEAERILRSLELFGMRFGLDRMRRMMTVLDSPQLRFDTIHVVGTNGKTSTTRMMAAILERHGLRTGAYTSPHLTSFSERVQVGEQDVDSGAFAAAVARAAWAAERVNRTLAEDDHVTQFELLTAAALWELARREVQVAVVEAGLGGRYDATNVISSRVTALTNVGLEHTRWLGPTVQDIAGEKLAVLEPGTILVLGAGLEPSVRALARGVARERRARVVCVGESPPAVPLAARGTFQQRNFAIARTAAEAYLQAPGTHGLAPWAPAQLHGSGHERAVRDAAAHTTVAGRLEIIEGDPLTVLDGAHNPDAVAALLESLPEILHGGETALVLGVLEDKDAAAMLAPLLDRCARAWFTAPPSDRALSPATLQSLARQLGFDADAAVCEPAPWRALEQAQSWARGRGGAVLVTGSVYLVGDLLGRMRGTGSGSGRSVQGSESGRSGGRAGRLGR